MKPTGPPPAGPRPIDEPPMSRVVRTILMSLALLFALGVLVGVLSPPASTPGAAPPDELRHRAIEQMKGRRFAGALQNLRLVHPVAAVDHLLRADALRELGRPDDALAELRIVPDGDSLGPQARTMEGQVELRRGRLRLAERHFRRALELDPKIVQAKRELIYIYGQQLRRREMAAIMESLSTQKALNFREAFLWCQSRITKWEPHEQVETLGGFLKNDPEDRWSRLALADAYVNLGRPDDAEATLGPMPEDDPEARLARARLAVERGDLARADALVAEGPEDNSDYARLRGRLALLRRDGPAAVAAYRAADAAEPNHRDTLHGLVQALRMVGDEEAAAPFAERARAHDELTSLVHYAGTAEGRADKKLPYRLGLAAEAAGEIPEARAWYQVAIDYDPLDPAAQRALFRLRGPSSRPAPNPLVGEGSGAGGPRSPTRPPSTMPR